MIHFKKYNSIENTFDKDFMEKIRTKIPDSQEFVVQEKAHGSNERIPDLKSLTIFGEMFAANTPTPTSKTTSKTVVMQKGVFYCPHHEFYAFDIYVSTEKSGRYLTVNEANAFIEHGSDATIEKSEQKILNRHVNKLATNLIKRGYMNR